MQCGIGAKPNVKNAHVGSAIVSIVPIFQCSSMPHPYGMALKVNHGIVATHMRIRRGNDGNHHWCVGNSGTQVCR